MWPVRVSLSCPEARSQILMVLSADPVANHSLPGSTATDLTHLNSVSEASSRADAGVDCDVVLHMFKCKLLLGPMTVTLSCICSDASYCLMSYSMSDFCEASMKSL